MLFKCDLYAILKRKAYFMNNLLQVMLERKKTVLINNISSIIKLDTLSNISISRYSYSPKV